MTLAEKLYSNLNDKEKQQAFKIFETYCPFAFFDLLGRDADAEVNKQMCKSKHCFECWMREV